MKKTLTPYQRRVIDYYHSSRRAYMAAINSMKINGLGLCEDYSNDNVNPIDPNWIYDVVKEKYGVNIRAKTKNRNVSMCRHIVRWLMRNYTGLSLKDIAHYTGGCDHTTVVHSVRVVRNLIDTNDDWGFDALELAKFIQHKN